MCSMATTIATTIATTVQFAYKRNFLENKWQEVGSQACKVQVRKKNGEFYLHITGNSVVGLFVLLCIKVCGG